MIIQSVELIHLKLPFKHRFVHASKTRTAGDTILIRLGTQAGLVGFGEVLPRSYVTGESIEGILDNTVPGCRTTELAESLLGQSFRGQAGLSRWIADQLPHYEGHTALFGGIELALWSLLSQENKLDIDTLLGPVSNAARGHCVTIGFDAQTESLRKYAIDARLKGATVVKLKIGLPDDIERLFLLDKCFKGSMPIRVDANGHYDEHRAEALLQACANTTALQSFEEPFSPHDENTGGIQLALYKKYRIDFVADESLCSLQDARRLQAEGAFQVFNLRIGKHGGLFASRQIRDFAAQHGIGLVSGSMVGESGVLTQAAELLLSHSTEFDYVEGLGQNTQFLLVDPVAALEGLGPMKEFTLKEAECESFVQNSLVFND